MSDFETFLSSVDPKTVTVSSGRFSGQTPEGHVVRVRLVPTIDEPRFAFSKRGSGQIVLHARAGREKYLGLLRLVLGVSAEACSKLKECC